MFQGADEFLSELRQKIVACIYSEGAPEGVLTADVKEYLECIELKKQ